jgi:hypothetical protein
MNRRGFLTGVAKLLGLALVLPAVKVLETVQARDPEPVHFLDLVDKKPERIWQDEGRVELYSQRITVEEWDQEMMKAYMMKPGRIEVVSNDYRNAMMIWLDSNRKIHFL